MVSPRSMIRAAQKSRHHNQKHACMIFRGGAVISMANNNRQRHAEIAALSKVKDCRNTVLLSVRVGKSGNLKNARPCPRCRDYILTRGIRVILYSTEEGLIEREKINATGSCRKLERNRTTIS